MAKKGPAIHAARDGVSTAQTGNVSKYKKENSNTHLYFSKETVKGRFWQAKFQK